MQPYFFPYLGYFQLINAVDKFVVYDNIQYTKRGWINRNRILVNGKDEYVTIPLKRDSDFLNIDQRFLSDDFGVERTKLLRRIEAAYHKAPCIASVMPLVERCLNAPNNNLFDFLLFGLREVLGFLGVQKEVVVSSSIRIDHSLKSQSRVLAICKELKCKRYVNPIGGKELYQKEIFAANGIELAFLRAELNPYGQFNQSFVPSLSIIDVMMFNPVETMQEILNQYSLE